MLIITDREFEAVAAPIGEDSGSIHQTFPERSHH